MTSTVSTETETETETETVPLETSVSSNEMTFSLFLTLLKNLLINPIISEKSANERIKDFANDLGELLVFLWKIALNIKDNTFSFLKESNK
tara:strand:+ start:89 stop:361 length:273 start_codon:yes stop_codon:yes gene_type:complete